MFNNFHIQNDIQFFIITATGAAANDILVIHQFNQTGLTADLSGVGFKKTFGDKNQGINTTIFGRQDFGAPAQYGARVGFNYKF